MGVQNSNLQLSVDLLLFGPPATLSQEKIERYRLCQCSDGGLFTREVATVLHTVPWV